MSKPEIETTSSKVVYRNPWMTVREDAIVRADGATGVYGVVEKTDYAVIVPYDEGEITPVEQFRYPVGARYWEVPQGSWEGQDVDPLALAHAELREETAWWPRR